MLNKECICRSGKARYETGAVYDGEFQSDQRSGWGTQCFPDESVYVGEWAKDTVTGDHPTKSLTLTRLCRRPQSM